MGDDNRASQSRRPVATPRRTLKLTLLDTHPPGKIGSAGGRVGAGTPDSGVPGSPSPTSSGENSPLSADSPSRFHPQARSPSYSSGEPGDTGDCGAAGDIGSASDETDHEEKRIWSRPSRRKTVPVPRAANALRRKTQPVHPGTPSVHGASDTFAAASAAASRAGSMREVARDEAAIAALYTPIRKPGRDQAHMDPSSLPYAGMVSTAGQSTGPGVAGAQDEAHRYCDRAAHDEQAALIAKAADTAQDAHRAENESVYNVIGSEDAQVKMAPPNSPVPLPPTPITLASHVYPDTRPEVRPPRGWNGAAAGATRFMMSAPASADGHPDVRLALSSLQGTLEKAAAHAPVSADRASRATGDARLRAIARSRRTSGNPLGDRSLAFYKALVPLAGAAHSARNKRVAVSLAALAQRAAAEGYDAVSTQLIRRTLAPRLHSLPLETLCELGRLRYSDDRNREEILLRAADLLGANKRRRTRKVEQAGRELEVAAAMLSVIGELCHEHARAMSWDRQVAIAIEAARNGHHEQLDAALRELWRGDLLTGEMERPRVSRLMDAIGRLAMDQRYALGAMLGVTEQADARSDNFARFEEHHLAEFEHDEAIRRQMARFIAQLRAATRAMLPAETHGDAVVGPTADTGSGRFDAVHYPAALKREQTIRGTFNRFRGWIAATFRRRPKTHDLAKAQIKQAILTLIDGGSPNADQLGALQSANRRLNGKLGQVKGASVHRMLIQDRLSKLNPDQLARLALCVAAARDSISSQAGPDGQDVIADFHAHVADALEREAGIRNGAKALTQLQEALPNARRRPEKLLDALDALADAATAAPDSQSELDFHEDVLRRLDPAVRKTLHKRLNGRGGLERHLRGVDSLIWHTPVAWSHYRRHQLETLSRAVHL
jgi:hypothetical protein